MNRLSNIFPLVIFTMLLCWIQTGWAQDQRTGAPDLDQVKVLDLPTAARIALADSPSLAAARARVGQAAQVVRQARSAYWPRLDLAASQARVDLSDNAYQSQMASTQALFGPGATVTDPGDYYRTSITATWVLFDGFSRWFDLAAAKHGEQVTAAARDDARRLLLQAVAGAFLSAQLSLENIAIAKADEAFNQRQLTEAKLRHEVGTGALSDVLNFEVKANSAQSDRILAENTYETARIGVAALLGLPDARMPQNLPLAALEPADEEELQAPRLEALLKEAQTRPDLLQNDWVVQQAQANVKSRRGDYFPTLSLSASYDGERTDDFGFESEDFGSTVGINLSFNIFAGGLFHARHQEARMRLNEAEKNLENVKINVASEIHNTNARVLSAQKQLLLLRTNARLVQKNRDLVEKEYKAGVGSLVRLNEAQRDLTAAQVRLATAQVALRQAWYDLWSAAGRIEAALVP